MRYTLYVVNRHIGRWNNIREGAITLPNQSPAFLPLTEPTLFILLSLASGEKHGYAILKDVRKLSIDGRRMSTSTLYEGLSRLLEAGMIERVEMDETPQSRRLRKAYRLSRTGRHALEAETVRMQRLVEHAKLRLAAEDER